MYLISHDSAEGLTTGRMILIQKKTQNGQSKYTGNSNDHCYLHRQYCSDRRESKYNDWIIRVRYTGNIESVTSIGRWIVVKVLVSSIS